LIAYLRTRRILKLTVLRAAIIAGTKWEQDNPPSPGLSYEQRAHLKRAAVELAETEAELRFLNELEFARLRKNT